MNVCCMCCCSVSKPCLTATTWTVACQASLLFTISRSVLKIMPTEWVMPSNQLILCQSPLLLPSIFPSSKESFPTSWHFISGGQSFGASASESVLPMNILDWLPLGLTGWFSLQLRDSQQSSPIPQFKSINSLAFSFLSDPYMISGKTIAVTRWMFVSKVMSLLFNMLV